MIDDVLEQAGLDWRYVDLFETVPASLPLDDAAGLVVLGGPMNVDEVAEYPFLAAEVEWLREAARRDLPVLGICLGAQLLAKALGATVRANERKEIGWYEIELTEAAGRDTLLADCASRQMVYQFHGDTFTLPPGAVHLARSAWCENQAFRFGRAAYGLQFHIEVTPAMAIGWVNQPHNRRMIAELDYIDPEQIRRETPDAIARMHAFGRRILPRFAAMCGGQL
ncbi:MAG TPA: type 1 glutamine amidotransferase [Thermoguttaceae bacterium]|nr:type 1 glutamine amidotransferase [Thermoguttaceae bacterium]